ncbi:triphosphoribosyl-dephospho-CoA synthase CitG [Shimwellia pseudoproteus]|uniref:triphosphoribosyl-dephospho-CoA synthase CitG n=1 Tax=Shimwellia pseudoproteus TaxID=570012 RepID=UPI0018EBE68B|nr:triphosphoribosyl-dephospho-CoA synthase CitG [Shimwellia pseudoproteus]MBJ3815861.1 triphosphoribosyl-dephospho-CoA synthase CitG [Shimwellia pseudoproteus]
MTGLPATNPGEVDVVALAEQALCQELMLTPKPGLVDSANSGAHRDMNYITFTRSIAAIVPWLRVFEQCGHRYAHLPAKAMLAQLRPAGIACEQAMFTATGGVNTHKGGIFALGLLCCAAGRLQARGQALTAGALCRQVSAICQGMVARELAGSKPGATAGQRQYQQLGLTGARGEAESGFATVRRYVLPGWHQAQGERRLHHALLRLMAINPDSNLVSRGGMAGLRYVQRYANTLLETGWQREDLQVMDRALIARNLSPGGSADLLSVAWVLAGVNNQ